MLEIAFRTDISRPDDRGASVAAGRQASARAAATAAEGLALAVRDLLSALKDGPLGWDGLEPGAGPALALLAARRVVEFRCVAGPRLLAVAFPSSARCAPRFDAAVSAGTVVRLSRFACSRRMGDDLVCESPLGGTRLHVRDQLVAEIITEIAPGQSVGDLWRRHPGEAGETVAEIVRFLVAMGIAGAVDRDGALAEDRSAELIQREFHDVLFHYASRQGLTDQALGAVYPFIGDIDPAPAVKPRSGAETIPLPRPDLSRVTASDPPFGTVMESRQSLRRYGPVPVHIDQVGEFLYRVARVRRVRPISPETGLHYEASSRTYPSGGATYDLELYLTVRSCEGIAAGIYHYEPADHALSVVSREHGPVVALINNAYNSTGREGVPQVLITLSSRFTRLGWKYRSIAYATTLKNVGVLYEAMYLTATSMGLAPCALGSGDSALFSQVTGLDPLTESSVGEFALGSRAQAG